MGLCVLAFLLLEVSARRGGGPGRGKGRPGRGPPGKGKCVGECMDNCPDADKKICHSCMQENVSQRKEGQTARKTNAETNAAASCNVVKIRENVNGGIPWSKLVLNIY